MKLPSKTLERNLFNDYRQVIGVDEVGMACLAGPVYVCALSFDREFFNQKHPELEGVRDSKLLSALQREKLFDKLTQRSDIKFEVAFSDIQTIDRVNIYNAARLAMKKAINNLTPDNKSIVLMDGKGTIPGITIHQRAIVGGDRDVFTIACASILAKVTRDKIMTDYAKKYPLYGFERHKGYPTKLHKTKLIEFGPCKIHRKSFARLSFWTDEDRTPWDSGQKI